MHTASTTHANAGAYGRPSPTIDAPAGGRTSAARSVADDLTDRMGIMGEVRLIAGALVTILIVALVLNEVYGAIEINNSSPWHEVVTQLENTGVAALGLLIVALLVLAASAILRIMGNSGFGGR